MSLFWPNDFESRQRLLQSYNPYTQISTNDPKLLRSLIVDKYTPMVNKIDADWKIKVYKNLSIYGQCRLVTTKDDYSYKSELHKLLAVPIDVDFLQLYVVIDGIQIGKDNINIMLKLREEW